MHPGMIAWWKHARRHAEHCGDRGREAGCGPGGGRHGWGRDESAYAGGHDPDGELGGGSFGVRRPLRFLAVKLELEEKQVAELASILNELKTERAQAAVDNRRTTSAFADAIAGDAFDAAKVAEAAAQRVKSAEKLRDAVAAALGKIHALLDAEQRAKLAYLIRTGALTI
jgi:Spy/CpxP family protein refolding chaperone